jgi:predicted dehydrogenase
MQSPMEKRDVRLAVVGVSSRGRMVWPAHRPGEGSAIVALCDTDPEALAKAQADLPGAELYTTTRMEELVRREDVDAIFLCTPDHLHEEHALICLAAGKHLFLEKPLAITIEGCDRILAAAEKSKGKLYVGHNMRFFPVFQKMREIIVSGRIGQVQAIWCRHFIAYGGDAYFKDWHSQRQYTQGLLLQKGAHDIDVIHWLAGGHTRRVVGMGKLSVYDQIADRRPPGEVKKLPRATPPPWPPLSHQGMSAAIDVEDHSMILMQLDNGVQASYQQCHYTPDEQRNYTVIGTEGRIENFGDHSSDNNWATIRLWTSRCVYQEEGTEVIKILPTPGGHGGADPGVIEDFLNVVRGGEAKGACPLDARMSVAAGWLATESLRNQNMPYDIPPVRRE